MSEWDFNLKKHNLLLLLFIVVFFVLFVPAFMRLYAGNTTVLGSESYLNMRYAQDLIDSKELTFQELVEKYELTPDLVYTRRTFHFNPYHVTLAFLGNIFGLKMVAQIMPLLLGIVALLLFARLLNVLKFNKYHRDIVLLIVASSPAFIYAFTVATAHSLAIVLSLLSILLFTKKDIMWFVASMVCLFLVSLFSVFNLVVLLACILAYAIHDERKKPWFFMALFISMFLLFVKRVNLYYSYTTHESLHFFTAISSDLGGMIGFGFVSILLVFLGTGRLWKTRKQIVVFLVPLLILASYVYVGEGFFMYLSFFVAIAVGDGLLNLVERDWQLSLLKGLTLIILICGIIFSTVSYTDRMIEADPHPETLHSLELLHKTSKGGQIVLTHPKYGYWVESYANRKVLADSLSTNNYNQLFLYKVADAIFASRNLETTEKLLRSYNIKYIWITPEMKEGLVWQKEEEGLLFLLENSETFKKVFSTYGYDVWEVRPAADKGV